MTTTLLSTHIQNYLTYCKNQKRLDEKTLKAYRIDLAQFAHAQIPSDITDITPDLLEEYVAGLHEQYKPRTVKRKIASLKAFFHYLLYKDFLPQNPFDKLQLRFREPIILPKTIPLATVETLLSVAHRQQTLAPTEYQRKNALRDTAVLELLFATGIRISELCSLHNDSIDLQDGTILIYGKGSKERRIQIGNESVLCILKKYKITFQKEILTCDSFFVNQAANPLSDQAVRRMINKYTELASIDMHITPHMFRHTFATSLLDADVDIRYIQEMLGHSSITITEIYTHVAVAKQRNILATRHPRNQFIL